MVNINFVPNNGTGGTVANTVEILTPNIVKQGDSENDFRVRLLHGETPVDLTTATVTWSAASNKGKFVTDRAATKYEGGEVGIEFLPEDEGAFGTLRVEFKVTYADGDIEKFPAHNYATFVVNRSLDDMSAFPVLYASVQYFEDKVTAAETAAASAEEAAISAANRALLVEAQGETAEAQGLFAQEQGTAAQQQAAAAQQVAVENKTRFLNAVSTVALRDSTYPNPVHGDTVRVTGESITYRFVTGSGWVKTDQYNPTAIDEVTRQLADTSLKAEKVANELKPRYSNNDSPIISFVDDDGYSEFLTSWKPVADAKGIKISLGIVSSWVGQAGRLTLAQLKQLKDEGYDLLSHSHTHANPATVTDTQWLEELRLSSEFMKTNNFNSDTLVLPVGYRNIPENRLIQLKALTRQYYDYAIDATETLNATPVDSMHIQRVGFDNADYATMKVVVDKAISRKQWLVVMTHSSLYPSADYSAIIDYIQSMNVPILTVSEALKRVGNIVSSGDTKTGSYFFASKDGKVNMSHTLQVDPQNANLTKPVTDYGFKKITVEQISYTSDTLTGKGGVLHTYRGDPNLSYRVYYISKSSEVYRSYWDETALSWTPFVLISNSTSASSGAYTPTFYGATVAGTPTYTTQKGNYSKMGNRVFLDVEIVLTTKTAIDGGLRISLPFPAKSGVASTSCAIGAVGRVTYGTAKEITALISPGNNFVSLYKTLESASQLPLLATDISDIFRVYISGSYETA